MLLTDILVDQRFFFAGLFITRLGLGQGYRLPWEQLICQADVIGVGNALRRDFPVEGDGFEGVAESDSVFARLTFEMMGLPFPAEDIEAHHAGAPVFVTVPFLVDHAVGEVAGGVECYFTDEAIIGRQVLDHIADADTGIVFIHARHHEDVIKALIRALI